MNTKQVIVVRKDLNMRKGKLCAQASHASMAFLTKNGQMITLGGHGGIFENKIYFDNRFEEIAHWLKNSFRKIVCYVDSEEELIAIHQKAIDSGLVSHIIEDNGTTEFNGVKTLTCCAIGPHWDSKYNGITDQLPLL